MRMRSLMLAAVLLVGCGLHRSPPSPAPARGPARDSLLQLDASRGDSVARRGPLDAMLGLLDSSVIYLRAGAPTVYGRDAAQRLLTPLSAGTSWEPLGGGVSSDLRSAYTFGVAARLRPPDGGGSPVRFEQYIAFWRRGSGGPWKIAAYAEINGLASQEIDFSPSQTTPPPLPPAKSARAFADATRTLRAADSLFADLGDRMGVAFAFSNTVAPGGAVFGGPRLIVGASAVREFFELRRQGASLTWMPVYASVAGSFDLGFTVGQYVSTERGPSGAAVQRFGKYLTVWGIQPGGEWKFLIDGGSRSR